MIKIKLRKNLVYLFIYYASWYIRKINKMLFQSIFDLDFTYIFLFMMTLGEFFGGLSLYLYQYKSIKHKTETKYFKINSFHSIELTSLDEIRIGDKTIKRIILIFLACFFDFMEFIIASFHVPFFDKKVSPTIDLRFGCITTIVSSLIYTYALRIKIVKHHKVSLIFMSSCLFLSFIMEMVYKQDEIGIGDLILARIFVLCYLTCISFTDCTERYLVDTNFISPFKVLMLEGIFEFIMTSFFSIGKDPFKDFIKAYNSNSAANFALLIFLLFNHLWLSAIVNSYKIYCNVIYSSMARSLMDYFMGPIFIIYYFFKGDDFNSNYIYFIGSEILMIIIDFFSCTYNEYIILFCFGLEINTKDEITERAVSLANIPPDPSKNYDEDEDNESESEKREEEQNVEVYD